MVLRAPPSQEQLASLEARIGYSFRDRSLLQLALFHPSFGFMNNMNLAWLGDKVLDLIESARCYRAMPPPATPAELHNEREARTTRSACAALGARLSLGEVLVVGRGFEGAVPSPNMLAEAFEAVLGAVFEDSNRDEEHGLDLATVSGAYLRLVQEAGRA